MVNPVLGTFVLAIGVAGAVWPTKVARFGEQLDAIGSKRSWSDVEPADWKVFLTRFFGIGMTLFGVFVFLDI